MVSRQKNTYNYEVKDSGLLEEVVKMWKSPHCQEYGPRWDHRRSHGGGQAVDERQTDLLTELLWKFYWKEGGK